MNLKWQDWLGAASNYIWSPYYTNTFNNFDKYFCNLDKYTLQFGQIQFAIRTNMFPKLVWGQRWIWNDRIGLVLHLTRTSSPLITWAGLTCWAEGVFICGRRRWSSRESEEKGKNPNICWNQAIKSWREGGKTDSKLLKLLILMGQRDADYVGVAVGLKVEGLKRNISQLFFVVQSLYWA